MSIVPNDSRQTFRLAGMGVVHRTLANALDGLGGMEVWQQTLGPRATTPIHYHECEEVIVILSGSGRVTLGDEVIDFRGDSTIIIPAHLVHQIVNTSREELHLIATLNASPAHVFAPDGSAIPLPWDVLE